MLARGKGGVGYWSEGRMVLVRRKMVDTGHRDRRNDLGVGQKEG